MKPRRQLGNIAMEDFPGARKAMQLAERSMESYVSKIRNDSLILRVDCLLGHEFRTC